MKYTYDHNVPNSILKNFVLLSFPVFGNHCLWQWSRMIRQGANAPSYLTRPPTALNKPPQLVVVLDYEQPV